MRKILAIILMSALVVSSAYALSTEAILNKVFDSTTGGGSLKAEVSGTITSADVVTDRLTIYDNTAIEDKISIDVVGGHAEFQPYSISAIKFNSSMADTDFVIGSVIDSEAFAVDSSTGRVGIGTRTPAVSLDVVGPIKAVLKSGATQAGAGAAAGELYHCITSDSIKIGV